MIAALRQLAYTNAGARPRPAARVEACADRDRRLGETLVRLGKLSLESIEKIAELQRVTNAPFAKAASKLGLLTREDIETAVGVQKGLLREGEGKVPANALIVKRPSSREAEQFRALRTRLLTSKEAGKLNLFAIAAAGSSREADHIAINLAASFAQLGMRALIVDADLRSTRLSSIFGVPAAPGFRESLAAECDIRKAIRRTVIANLDILTAGAPSITGPALLSAQALGLTFDYLRCAYDVVIVTTSPFGLVADAQFVWAAAGGAFVVTRRHKDRLAELKCLNSALRQVDAAIIGAALAG